MAEVLLCDPTTRFPSHLGGHRTARREGEMIFASSPAARMTGRLHGSLSAIFPRNREHGARTPSNLVKRKLQGL